MVRSCVGMKENDIFSDQAKKKVVKKNRNKGEYECDTTIDIVKCWWCPIKIIINRFIEQKKKD